MKLKTTDYTVPYFMGTDFQLTPNGPETIGEFKSLLEQIASRLPEDNSLEISDFSVYDGKITYTLRKGFPIEND